MSKRSFILFVFAFVLPVIPSNAMEHNQPEQSRQSRQIQETGQLEQIRQPEQAHQIGQLQVQQVDDEAEQDITEYIEQIEHISAWPLTINRSLSLINTNLDKQIRFINNLLIKHENQENFKERLKDINLLQNIKNNILNLENTIIKILITYPNLAHDINLCLYDLWQEFLKEKDILQRFINLRADFSSLLTHLVELLIENRTEIDRKQILYLKIMEELVYRLFNGEENFTHLIETLNSGNTLEDFNKIYLAKDKRLEKLSLHKELEKLIKSGKTIATIEFVSQNFNEIIKNNMHNRLFFNSENNKLYFTEIILERAARGYLFDQCKVLLDKILKEPSLNIKVIDTLGKYSGYIRSLSDKLAEPKNKEIKDRLNILDNLIKTAFTKRKLFSAVRHQDLNRIKIYAKRLNKLSSDLKDHNGENPIHHAVMLENSQMILQTFSLFPKLIMQKNNNKQTPIHLAAGDIYKIELIKQAIEKLDHDKRELAEKIKAKFSKQF